MKRVFQERLYIVGNRFKNLVVAEDADQQEGAGTVNDFAIQFREFETIVQFQKGIVINHQIKSHIQRNCIMNVGQQIRNVGKKSQDHKKIEKQITAIHKDQQEQLDLLPCLPGNFVFVGKRVDLGTHEFGDFFQPGFKEWNFVDHL